MHELPSDSARLGWVKEAALVIENYPGLRSESPELADEIFDAALPIVSRMTKIDPSRDGGVLIVADTGENPFCFARKIGKADKIDPDAKTQLDWSKIDKYLVFASMKLFVLAQNPGWQTSRANLMLPPDGRYKIEQWDVPVGAIRIPGTSLVIAFSGFQPDDDESICLATAVEAGLFDIGEAFDLSHSTGNKRFPSIANQLLY